MAGLSFSYLYFGSFYFSVNKRVVFLEEKLFESPTEAKS